MTPEPGMIYRHAGNLMLYVRTEQRPGAAQPEHLFVHTQDRTILHTWLAEAPAQAELAHDTEGRKQANEESWLRLVAEDEARLLVGLLQKACALLPAGVAAELRDEYRQRRQ